MQNYANLTESNFTLIVLDEVLYPVLQIWRFLQRNWLIVTSGGNIYCDFELAIVSALHIITDSGSHSNLNQIIINQLR